MHLRSNENGKIALPLKRGNHFLSRYEQILLKPRWLARIPGTACIPLRRNWEKANGERTGANLGTVLGSFVILYRWDEDESYIEITHTTST